jgi:hypothetical protein
LSHGYCTDDNARLLIFAARETDDSREITELTRLALEFVLAAQDRDGRVRNRLSYTRRWMDDPSTDDCWGRALWSLGTVAARGSCADLRRRGFGAFERSAQHRSRWIRANCFAALGAVEILAQESSIGSARDLLADCADDIGATGRMTGRGAGGSFVWPWPEPELTYANAVIAEVAIASGSLLRRSRDLDRGLELLDWLVRTETHDGHLSPTPVGGRRPGEHGPAFDQQPIEVAALADAAHRAWCATGDPRWHDEFVKCHDWFLGHNDLGVEMFDRRTGGGYDGLTPTGPNMNQGAESTLALLTTLQERSPI